MKSRTAWVSGAISRGVTFSAFLLMDYDEPSFERSKVANFSVTYRNILFSDYAIALSALEAD